MIGYAIQKSIKLEIIQIKKILSLMWCTFCNNKSICNSRKTQDIIKALCGLGYSGENEKQM